MADEPEVIRHQMEEKRADITEKLETLEDELAEKVQSATDTVSETVAEVKETVQDTTEAVRETVHETLQTVKSAFDIPYQVERHPWLMFGGAVALGYVGGCVLNRLEEPTHPAMGRLEGYDSEYQAELSGLPPEGRREEPSASKWLGELAVKFRPELDQLKGLAVGAALSVARDLLGRALPEEARPKVAETVDSFIVKLGGKPIHGLVPPEEAEQRRPEPTAAG
jgi:ElaB/YqjD/DUF883 family membrane-anchored ribosome-binding protein